MIKGRVFLGKDKLIKPHSGKIVGGISIPKKELKVLFDQDTKTISFENADDNGISLSDFYNYIRDEWENDDIVTLGNWEASDDTKDVIKQGGFIAGTDPATEYTAFFSQDENGAWGEVGGTVVRREFGKDYK